MASHRLPRGAAEDKQDGFAGKPHPSSEKPNAATQQRLPSRMQKWKWDDAVPLRLCRGWVEEVSARRPLLQKFKREVMINSANYDNLLPMKTRGIDLRTSTCEADTPYTLLSLTLIGRLSGLALAKLVLPCRQGIEILRAFPLSLDADEALQGTGITSRLLLCRLTREPV